MTRFKVLLVALIVLAVLVPTAVFADDTAANSTPDKAITLTAKTAKVGAEIFPTAGQPYAAYYLLQYPGKQTQMGITVNFNAATDFVNLRAVGINVYNPSGKLVAHRDIVKKKGPVFTAGYIIGNDNPGTYLLQIQNFTGAPLHFDLSVSGLQ
jgi:hypothetical protein